METAAVTLSPAMLEYLRARCGDVPEIRLLLDENERLREALKYTEGYLSLIRYRAELAREGGPLPFIADVDRVITQARVVLYGEPKP